MSELRLYDYNPAIKDFLEENLDTDTGELQNTDTLLKLYDNQKEKITNTALYYKDVNASICALKEEEEKMKARRKSLEGTAEWVKNYLFANVKTGEKIDHDPRYVISFRKSTKVILKAKESAIPLFYKNTKYVTTVDLALLKNDIKAGSEAAMKIAELREYQNIQIK